MNKTLILLAALALGLFPLGLPIRADSAMSGMNMSQTPKPAPLSVTAAIKPNPPRAGSNTLDLLVTDAAGKPVTGLKLRASVAMTSMDMGTTTPAFTDAGNGHYTAAIVFGMAGTWRVVITGTGGKLAALDFQAGGKTPWKSPASKTPLAAAAAPPKAAPSAAMPGMDMSSAPTAKPADAAPASPPASSGMGGMDMSGMDMSGAGISGMKMGIADMKTAAIPRLQEMGTYTATGDENWKQQTGFGHNAPMVGMMNRMMVGGSGGEGMKMAPMKMRFGPANYAKPEADNAGNSMAGMNMDTPMAGSNTPSASAPVNITATTVSTPKAGDNPLTISITDAQGKPITGATITTTVAMTSMDMGTTHPAVMEKGNGKYAATVTFGMAGPWRVTVKVTPPGQTPQIKAFDFTAR